jgi:uncharacterized protein (UPF0332 family)
MSPDNERTNAREEAVRGNEALRAAVELHRLGLYNDAVSRAYYAAYHWARAVLFTKGLESRTHRGAHQLLALHFVRAGLLPETAATLLGQLEDRRETSDYTAAVSFTAAESEEALRKARAFIAVCAALPEIEAVVRPG